MGLIFCIASFTILILTVTVAYFRWAFSYWKRKKLPYIKPTFPFGTIENPLNRQEPMSVRVKKQYHYFKSQRYKHGGLYTISVPVYLPVNLDYIRNVLVKDFQYFTDRGTFYNKRDDPLSVNVVHLKGQKWKDHRTKLTPAFTLGKIKWLFPRLLACSNQLIEAIDKFSEEGKPIDIKDVCNSYTIDIIGSYVFGINFNSLNNANKAFKTHGETLLSPKIHLNALKTVIAETYPKVGCFLRMVNSSTEMTMFFMNVVKDTVKSRKTTNASARDFLQILIELEPKVEKDKGNEKSERDRQGFTIKEMAAHAFAFFVAGYETSAATMSFCLYELTLNTQIQENLREEILSTFENYDQSITYEGLTEMKLMDQVVNETLRKYPPVTVILRRCVKDYQIPNSHVTIEKGTSVQIPVLALHHDPEYYPNPDQFDPDRFNSENKRFVRPFTFMPFGVGPRNCIGYKIGLAQVKVGLAYLLKHFRFSLNKNTKVPLTMDPYTFTTTPKGGIWLDVEKI